MGARNKRYRRNSLWNDPVEDRKMGESFLYAFHEQGIGGPSSRSRATGHDSLHLWMPERRRRPTGLGKPDFPKCRPRIQPYQLKLDIESIENRRNEVELKRRGQTNVHATHNELRQSIMNRMDEECNIIQSALRNTRTNEGLYISALEQPDDWPTSYDCLGIVRPGITCKDPSIIHKNYQIPCGGKQKRNETGENKVSGVREQTDEGPEQPIKVKAQEIGRPITSTLWAEETCGRREFHAYMGVHASSPVNSPPHSPQLAPHAGS